MGSKVDHPQHYQSAGGIECIDYIESLGFGDGFELGNAIKYIVRAGKKDSEDAADDMNKALWYIRRYMRANGLKEEDM